MKFLVSILALSSYFFITSCDALVSMSYSVKNKTKGEITLSVPGYSTDRSLITKPGVDTIIRLARNEKIIVNCAAKLDLPFGTKNLYRAHPGICGIERIDLDSTISYGCTKKEWKYRRKNSTLTIK